MAEIIYYISSLGERKDNNRVLFSPNSFFSCITQLTTFSLGGGGALPIMAHVGRLRLKRVSFSRFRYMKGLGTFSFIQVFKRALIKIFPTLIPDDCSFLIYWMQHENDKKISCLEVIWKGYHLSMKGTRKGYIFCKKWYINKRVRGQTPWGGPSHINFV